MAEWVEVGRVAELPPGAVRSVDCDGTRIAVFNLAGTFHAIEDLCSHEAETLSDGEVDGEEVVCPRHGARFSIITGAALSPPAYEAVETFPVRIADGVVQVWNPRRD